MKSSTTIDSPSSSPLLSGLQSVERTVPALVLKHDFDTSNSNVATPRPLDVKTPDSLQISYHGQSHYNSVIDPKIPLPLTPLSTTYIRQGRILREAANEIKSTTTTTTAGTLSASAAAVKAEEVKKKKKESRRAFFQFRTKKNKNTNPPNDIPPVIIDNKNSKNSKNGKKSKKSNQGTKTTPRLEPMSSAPSLLSKLEDLDSNTNVIVGDGRAKGRQERQRPSLPSLPSAATTEKALQKYNNERKTIPKAGDPSPRPNMDFMNKADALLKNNLDQLNARIAKKIQKK